MIPFDFNGWTCTLTRNGHLFKHPDKPSILVRRGDYDGQLFVQRGWLRRVFNMNPKAYGPPSYYGEPDGGLQGGSDIELYPKWARGTQAKLDGTIRRHHIGKFNEKGEPLAPWPGPRYPLAARYHGDGYQDIDGAHLIRAYEHAVAQFAHDRDPVARMWLILCAREIMRRFPILPFTDGEGPEYSLATMHKNVFADPHRAKLGVIRELAHSLRCVVESQRVAPMRLTETWITRFVEMLYMGQALNGAFGDFRYGEAMEQEAPWTVAQPGGFTVLSTDEGEFPSFQARFLYVALHEASKVVPATRTHVRVMLERAKRLEDSCVKVPDLYRPELRGLPRWVIVSRGGQLLSTVTEGVGYADTTYDEDMRKVWREQGL